MPKNNKKLKNKRFRPKETKLNECGKRRLLKLRDNACMLKQ